MPVRAIAGRPSKIGRPLPVVNRLRPHSTPPPVGGWNARDSLANMEEDDAVELVNWFPEETRVRVRRGHSSHAIGLNAPVQSLLVWNGPTASKIFGAAGAGIYNVTSSGMVGSPDVTGASNAQWQQAMFSGSAGNYLFAVNGADNIRRYDGTNWAVPTFSGTGLTNSNLIHVNVFKNRLFFVEKNTLNFWYGGVDSLAGTLTKFDLGSNASKGGHLMAMGTWTRDGGDGVDDLAVFLTSEGQAIIYQGTNPGDSSVWSLIGVFNIGAPLGRRCFTKVGAELIVLTEDGFAPISRFLASGRASNQAAVSDKIRGAVQAAVRDGRSRFGWEAEFYPSGDMILFNVPGLSENVQFVSHATSGAWCKFTGWDAECFGGMDNTLYFGGSDGVVYKADTGLNDNGQNINATAKTAFTYFGNRGLVKRVAMIRPVLTVDGVVSASIRANTDYEDLTTNSDITFADAAGAEWDEAEWDEAGWGEGGLINKDWHTVGAIGTCASLRFQTASKNGTVFWASTDWRYESVANAGFI